MKGKKADLVGKRFGRLVVLSLAYRKDSAARWLCRCDCGTVKTIHGSSLTRQAKATKSCGCLNKERVSQAVSGKHNLRWKGGIRKHADGYIEILKKDHPRANSHGYVMQHILVMESMTRNPIPKGAVIHHCNGNKSDNRPFNLRLFPSQSKHFEYHKRLAAIIRDLPWKERT